MNNYTPQELIELQARAIKDASQSFMLFISARNNGKKKIDRMQVVTQYVQFCDLMYQETDISKELIEIAPL
jgi:hypothetical protein